MIKFHCDAGYMMEGQPILSCIEDRKPGDDDNVNNVAGKESVGRWSGKAPVCVRACTYPGTAIGGMISDVRFYYKVGSTVRFECAAGLSISGARMLECLPSGAWSGSVPTCNKQTGGASTDK